MSTKFDLRLVAYNPLGARLGVLPDLGITISATATGPALSAVVSTKNLGQIGTVLPKNLEVAVETWRDTDGGVWKEQRDSRFAITNQDYDSRDLSGTVTLTGVGIGAWLLQAAVLRGVNYLSYSTVSTEAALSGTISVSGTVFTWTGNAVGNGDRIQIVSKGGAKNIDSGSIYYVFDLSGNTFHLRRSPTSTANISAGTASNISVKRVVTRLVITGHGFTKSQAVRTTAGGSTQLNDGTTYYVVNPSTNTIQLADKPGGVPIDLNVGSYAIGTVYTDVDGQRVFNSATPGTIMSTAFLEARGRGWGVGLDGTTQMGHSWTVTTDSTGAAWTTIAADPSTPGVSMSFQPGTPATQMLSFLLDNQYAEWYCSGRNIGLVNYGTGNDHTTDVNPPVRIGRTATSIPVAVDLTGERNSYIIRGFGAVYVQQTGTVGPWGVLEDYQTYSGISSKTSATKQAATNIATNATGQIGYKVTENAGEADFLPGINYSRGDWLAAQVDGDGWTKLRVVEWSYQKTADGTITVTTTLQYAKRSALVKAIKGSVTSGAGISDAGTGSSPILADDNRKSAAPVISGVTQVGRFAADDSATSVVTVSWAAASADIDGNPLTVVGYEVWLREEGKTFGYAAGETAGLTLDLPPLPSGRYYEVSVRAESATGQWGELSAETEFVTVYPTDAPNPPTAPSLSGRLGGVRVAWDGNLVDPNIGTVGANDSTQRGFAYVQVWYSSTSGGPYTQIGSNMGNAGSVAVSSLAIGSTYYFVLVAFNVVGGQSITSSETAYTVVGVTGPDLVANSVTANAIAAGAITADKLNIGAVPATASPTERVPKALIDNTYWPLVISGAVNLGTSVLNAAGLTSSSAGVNFVSTTSQATQLPVTAILPVPASGKIFVATISTNSQVFPQVIELNASGGSILTTNLASNVNGTAYTFSSSAVSYYVKYTTAGGTAMNDTLVTSHVFEVISTAGAGQGVELSPAGLQFFDGTSNEPSIDLSTNAPLGQVFSVNDTTQTPVQTVANIDQYGNASFLGEVSVGGFDIGGILMVDPSNPDSLLNAAPNGTTWNPSTAILDYFPRGVIYDVTWQSMDAYTVASGKNSVRIAQDSFILENGRQYMLHLQSGGLQISDGSPQNNIYYELQLSTTPITNITTGSNVSRGVALTGTGGSFVTQSPIFAATTAITTIPSTANLGSRMLPANVPIYWQLDVSQGGSVTASWTLHEFGYTRGLTIVDLGASDLQRPNGNDTLPDVSNVVQIASGGSASAGSGSSGTTATSKTVTFTATSSRTWNQGGSNIVTGSGTYDNGAAMYVGTGVSSMGSWFGNFKNSGGTSMASVLSGKTVTAAVLKIKCNYTYSSAGSTVPMGTGASPTAPSTIGTPANNTFSVSVKAGATKSITLGSAIRSGLSSGGVQAFVIGVASGGSGVYSYFAGATQSGKPTLTVTYH